MDKKLVDIEKLASWLVLYFNHLGTPISPFRLQKILYYCQAWSLAFLDHPLFRDEPEAWVRGPIYKKIYNIYNVKGAIWDQIKNNNVGYVTLNENKLDLNKDQLEVIEEVIKKYSALPDIQLALITNNELPWNETRKDCEPFGMCDDKIKHKLMSDYYKSRLVEK